MKKRPTIEELINRSSLGTPKAIAIRRQTPAGVVARIVAAEKNLRPTSGPRRPTGDSSKQQERPDPPEKEPPSMSSARKVVPLGAQFVTGQACEQSGIYRFVHYKDGTHFPSPTENEKRIPLSVGETFPPIRSTNKGAVWALAQYA